MTMLADLLNKHQAAFHPLFQPDLRAENTYLLDLTMDNKELESLDLFDARVMHDYIFGKISSHNARYAFGGYMEDRAMYRRSKLFHHPSGKVRSIHLGTDVWAPEGTEVHLPLNGRVHSFQNNSQPGDYGPTIIMEHTLEGTSFHTLYGHLSMDSIQGIHVGQTFSAGDVIARLGSHKENGDWPPHLHFQVISRLEDRWGDFPGVSYADETEAYTAICPDPAAFFRTLTKNQPQ